MNTNPKAGIVGYRALSDDDISLVNGIKLFEGNVAEFVAGLRASLQAKSQSNMQAIHDHKQTFLKDGVEMAYDRHGAVTDESVRQAEMHRQLAMARTSFEQAFMHLVRAATSPETPWHKPRAPANPGLG